MSMRLNPQLAHWVRQGVFGNIAVLSGLQALGEIWAWLRAEGDQGSQSGTDYDVTSGLVDKWWDASGNGRHATASGDVRPAYIADTGYGFPAVNIGGTTGFPTRKLAFADKSFLRNRSKVNLFILANFEDTNNYSGVFMASEAGSASDPRFSIELGDGTNRIQTKYLREDSDTLDQSMSADNTYTPGEWALFDIELNFAAGTYEGKINGLTFVSGTFDDSGNTDDTDSAAVEIGNPYNFGTYADNMISDWVAYVGGFDSADRRVAAELIAESRFLWTPFFYAVWGAHWFEEIPDDHYFASFQVTGDTAPGLSAPQVGCDINYSVIASNYDPSVTMYVPGSWTDRDSGTIEQGTLHLPEDFILPDTNGIDTPNNPTIVLNRITDQAICFNGTCRPVAGGPIYGYKDDGSPRTHGGSGLIGGEILKTELDAGLIEHALAINVWGEKYLSSADTGFVAPATMADSDYDDSGSADYYGGNYPEFVMGSRLAIPEDVTAASIGVTSAAAVTVFNALQTYGAFVVDNTAWDNIDINADEQAAATLSTVESELQAIYQALELVLPPILDRVTGAAAAYGLRKLRSDYTGPAIRVRRSSDNAELDIGFSGHELDTAALLAHCGAGSGFITTWYDQSGNSRNATQATSGSQPRIVNSGTLDVKNGKPTLVFDGAASHLATATGFLYAAGSASIMSVLSGPAQNSKYVFAGGNTADAIPLYSLLRSDASTGNKATQFIRNGATTVLLANDTAGPVLFDSALHVFSAVDNGTSVVQRVDGGTATTSNYTRSGTLTTNTLGIGALVRNTVSNWFQGDMSEAILHTSAISDANRQSIARDQARYFGITLA